MSFGVVVDTTVWIDFFRGRNEPVCRKLRELLRREEVVLVGIVVAEVLQGIQSPSEEKLVEDHFAALRYIETSWNVWRAAAHLGRSLRTKGFTLPLSDLVVAATAMEHDLPVYSTDLHFTRISGLVLHKT